MSRLTIILPALTLWAAGLVAAPPDYPLVLEDRDQQAPLPDHVRPAIEAALGEDADVWFLFQFREAAGENLHVYLKPMLTSPRIRIGNWMLWGNPLELRSEPVTSRSFTYAQVSPRDQPFSGDPGVPGSDADMPFLVYGDFDGDEMVAFVDQVRSNRRIFRDTPGRDEEVALVHVSVVGERWSVWVTRQARSRFIEYASFTFWKTEDGWRLET